MKFESYNLQSKNLVHKGVDFMSKMLGNSPMSIFNSKKISVGCTPGSSLKGREKKGKEGKRRRGGR